MTLTSDGRGLWPYCETFDAVSSSLVVAVVVVVVPSVLDLDSSVVSRQSRVNATTGCENRPTDLGQVHIGFSPCRVKGHTGRCREQQACKSNEPSPPPSHTFPVGR
ncbi:hypothetical protein BCR44DRAFT_1424604 [Catenaria anguillulae PL171]|uniref:Uncharacterized protein n=1 Tax=Catenaria anguillulae PL171 TaxID=765915 RepID=A0A1Y2I009_9FUNG|nr:hypothetical protein BCR44DRAFT_1424604 [Catenaria anguillulae PL171]